MTKDQSEAAGRPLDGVLVVALEQAVAAPFCTARLADAGARVIKIERPEGDFARDYDHVVDGESSYFVWLNRGKQSIALDIKTPGDASLLDRMIASADVFIPNLAPGAAERSGFGSAALRERHPRLITCDISGYGEAGEWAQMKAYDFLVQCEAGLTAITGNGAEAARVGVSVADLCCGMNAHGAILQALYERERTGRGGGVAISLFDGLAEWMTPPLLHFEHGGRAPGRTGMHHPTIAPYGPYRCDGGEVAIAIQSQREWRVFCERVMHDPALANAPGLATNTERCANRPALDTRIAEVFEALSVAALIERLRAAGLAYGQINDVAGLSRHPALRRFEVGLNGSSVRLPAPPLRWNGEAPSPAALFPVLDAHGEALRQEFSERTTR